MRRCSDLHRSLVLGASGVQAASSFNSTGALTRPSSGPAFGRPLMSNVRRHMNSQLVSRLAPCASVATAPQFRSLRAAAHPLCPKPLKLGRSFPCSEGLHAASALGVQRTGLQHVSARSEARPNANVGQVMARSVPSQDRTSNIRRGGATLGIIPRPWRKSPPL